MNENNKKWVLNSKVGDFKIKNEPKSNLNPTLQITDNLLETVSSCQNPPPGVQNPPLSAQLENMNSPRKSKRLPPGVQNPIPQGGGIQDNDDLLDILNKSLSDTDSLKRLQESKEFFINFINLLPKRFQPVMNELRKIYEDANRTLNEKLLENTALEARSCVLELEAARCVGKMQISSDEEISILKSSLKKENENLKNLKNKYDIIYNENDELNNKINNMKNDYTWLQDANFHLAKKNRLLHQEVESVKKRENQALSRMAQLETLLKRDDEAPD
eukprot:GHVL01016312.1.p2 GENE.GHVL01016312.1~~GHVL01016312.1.p2  ORF type:complete len:308 (-),score=105.31 GHVL01016312.1:1614-2435(-)